MKKTLSFLFALAVLTVGGLYTSYLTGEGGLADGGMPIELASSDVPGDGFTSGDPCGFVMGVGEVYLGHQIRFTTDYLDDEVQGCVDKSGYFYSDGADRDSGAAFYMTADDNKPYVFDLVTPAPLPGWPSWGVVVDQTTGFWSGYARIISAPEGVTLEEPEAWVWFDWKCKPGSPCGDPSKYRVKTNLLTGTISGYAWNDKLGWIDFNGLTQELAPVGMEVYVDVLANGSNLGTTAVDASNAPLADAYDYWRVRAQFADSMGNPLNEEDVEVIEIDVNETADSQVYLNQVENTGEAIGLTAENSAYGCATDDKYCAQTEDGEGAWDGSFSANKYIYSGSPTSNMLGLDNDADPGIDRYADREGCKWIYQDQAELSPMHALCDGTGYLKGDVFFARSDARNKYEIETITVTFKYNGERSVEESDRLSCDLVPGGGEQCIYTYVPDSETNEGSLSFRSRYQNDKFAAYYDGSEYDEISTDISKDMMLRSHATVSGTSQVYRDSGGAAFPKFAVTYQLDAVSTTQNENDNFLIMDNTAPQDSVEDCSYRIDVVPAGVASYGKEYALGYGQRYLPACSLGTRDITSPAGPYTDPAANILSSPTAEQWVCDDSAARRFKSPSCYYTGYLPIIDAHAEAYDVTISGAINSLLDVNGTLSGEDDVSILGNTDTIKLRNKMYAQIARYTVGQSFDSGMHGSNVLNAAMRPSVSSRFIELLNGRLIYAEGDVIITGSSGFNNKTLVTVGGDVYIGGNVTGGRLGVIALRSEGTGGNVYIDPSVTDLYANFFLDGSLFSDSGTADEDGTPVWVNDEERSNALGNQLYINGSLSARNTINGVFGDSPYPLGDGTTTEDYSKAREYDLNFLREYRLCYPLDGEGRPITTAPEEEWIECGSGESLSTTYSGETNYSPLIVEYASADALPIFTVETGLFN